MLRLTRKAHHAMPNCSTAFFLGSLALLFFVFVAAAQAQEGGEPAGEGSASKEGAESSAEEGKKEKEEFIRTGTIASTGSYGFGPQTVDSDSTGAAPGDEASVITGSVSMANRDECQVTISNTSPENGYSVRYRVSGTRNGSKVFSRSFSDRLDSGESKSRMVRCDKDWNMSVNLTSASKR